MADVSAGRRPVSFLGGNFSKDGTKNGIYLSSLSKHQKDFLVAARSNPGFAQTGYVFYVDEQGRLRMQPFDPDTGHVTGDGRVIASTVGFQPSLFYGAFTVSAGGTVVIQSRLGCFRNRFSHGMTEGERSWGSLVGRRRSTTRRCRRMGSSLAADIADPEASNA